MAKYENDNNTGIWRYEHGNIVAGPSSERIDNPSAPRETSKPNFIISALVSAALGLESWMLTMAITAFMPESVVGRPTFSSVLGREYGNVGLQLLTAISVLGVIVFPIVVKYLAEESSILEDERPSLTALAGSILPIYSFIYAIMPVNTEIFFGVSVVSEIVLLVIGLVLESKYGGRFGFVRGLLEYAVSFALFSSLLTFPAITRNFFGVFGFIVVLVAAAVFLYDRLSAEGPIITETDLFSPVRMDYGDATYKVLHSDWNKVEVEDERGFKYTYDKTSKTWRDKNGQIVYDTDRRGLDDSSRFYGW